jgi:hypothetical protein
VRILKDFKSNFAVSKSLQINRQSLKAIDLLFALLGMILSKLAESMQKQLQQAVMFPGLEFT